MTNNGWRIDLIARAALDTYCVGNTDGLVDTVREDSGMWLSGEWIKVDKILETLKENEKTIDFISQRIYEDAIRTTEIVVGYQNMLMGVD